MAPLYKYLPSKFVSAFIDKGEILFRNLAHFHNIEDVAIGDDNEGIHTDAPDNDVTLSMVNSYVKSVGKYYAVNKLKYPDLVFAFCLSNSKNSELLTSLKYDACIEIYNPDEFVRRVRVKVMQSLSTDKKFGLIAKSANYYDPKLKANFSIQDARELPFVKNKSYEYQDEFRLVFGKKKGFDLTQQFLMPGHIEHKNLRLGAKKIIKINALHDVARVINF